MKKTLNKQTIQILIRWDCAKWRRENKNCICSHLKCIDRCECTAHRTLYDQLNFELYAINLLLKEKKTWDTCALELKTVFALDEVTFKQCATYTHLMRNTHISFYNL